MAYRGIQHSVKMVVLFREYSASQHQVLHKDACASQKTAGLEMHLHLCLSCLIKRDTAQCNEHGTTIFLVHGKNFHDPRRYFFPAETWSFLKVVNIMLHNVQAYIYVWFYLVGKLRLRRNTVMPYPLRIFFYKDLVGTQLSIKKQH